MAGDAPAVQGYVQLLQHGYRPLFTQPGLDRIATTARVEMMAAMNRRIPVLRAAIRRGKTRELVNRARRIKTRIHERAYRPDDPDPLDELLHICQLANLDFREFPPPPTRSVVDAHTDESMDSLKDESIDALTAWCDQVCEQLEATQISGPPPPIMSRIVSDYERQVAMGLQQQQQQRLGDTSRCITEMTAQLTVSRAILATRAAEFLHCATDVSMMEQLLHIAQTAQTEPVGSTGGGGSLI